MCFSPPTNNSINPLTCLEPLHIAATIDDNSQRDVSKK